MAVLLKDVEELKEVGGELYAFDPDKRYLLVIPGHKPVGQIERLVDVLKTRGLHNVAIVVGIGNEKWKMFEMEHQV